MTVQQTKGKNIAVSFYKNNYEHLTDELRKLDLLIQLRVTAFRLRTQAMQEAVAAQKMYISHEEVDWLLNMKGSLVNDHPELQKICKQLDALQNKISARIASSIEQKVSLALPQLAHLFALSPFEIQTVIVCLAPELERKYDKLYAY